MKVLSNGYFSDAFSAEDLSKGLRKSEYVPRNTKTLTSLSGGVGRDGILKTLDQLTLADFMEDAGIVHDDFPFPQLFVLEKHVLLCNRQSIMELRDDTFIPVITGLAEGGKWNVASSHGFIYLTNGAVAVTRNPGSKSYSVSTTAPVSSAVCNYNGQIIVEASI